MIRFTGKSWALVATGAGLVALGVACDPPPAPHAKRAPVDREENIYGILSRGSASVANDLIENRWDLGQRFPIATIDEPITWTEDPFQDRYWRFLFYSLRPTSNLLYAYYSTGKTKYLDKLASILKSYAAYDAQRLVGPPYDRTRFDYRHGAAFRAMVLVNTLAKLERSGDISPDLASSLRASIERLGTFLAIPMNFDPDYNHGFTEAAALALIAANYLSLPSAAAWQATALDRLSSLMVNSVDVDGVELENSPFYHFYVLSFAYQINRWARRYGVPLSGDFETAMRGMVPYATFVLQPDGSIPLAGASVELGVENLDPAVYQDLAKQFPEFEYVYSMGASGTPPTQRGVLFPVSGQTFLRSGFGSGDPHRVQRGSVAHEPQPPRRSRHGLLLGWFAPALRFGLIHLRSRARLHVLLWNASAQHRRGRRRQSGHVGRRHSGSCGDRCALGVPIGLARAVPWCGPSTLRALARERPHAGLRHSAKRCAA